MASLEKPSSFINNLIPNICFETGIISLLSSLIYEAGDCSMVFFIVLTAAAVAFIDGKLKGMYVCVLGVPNL